MSGNDAEALIVERLAHPRPGDQERHPWQPRHRSVERESLASIGEFTSMIFHEIRSPLSTIAMTLEYIQDEQLSDGASKRIRLASLESERLQSLLGEILFFAKPREVRRELLNLDTLIDETVDELRQLPLSERRRIEYRCTAEATLISGDRDKLKQVLINLISNACEAIGERQAVTVELREGRAQNELQVVVRNPGTIPKQDLAKLTQPFFSTKSQGTGLGLAIVDHIVDAHGGELAIRSDPSEDVDVTVTLSHRLA